MHQDRDVLDHDRETMTHGPWHMASRSWSSY